MEGDKRIAKIQRNIDNFVSEKQFKLKQMANEGKIAH